MSGNIIYENYINLQERQKKSRKTHEETDEQLRWGRNGTKVIHLHESYTIMIKKNMMIWKDVYFTISFPKFVFNLCIYV
jgi:hypothetical protein